MEEKSQESLYLFAAQKHEEKEEEEHNYSLIFLKSGIPCVYYFFSLHFSVARDRTCTAHFFFIVSALIVFNSIFCFPALCFLQ